MFEHLSDPNPPTPGAEQRAAVGNRAATIRRRARAVQSVMAITAVLVVVGGVLAFGPRSGSDSVDVLNPSGDCCGSISGTVNGDKAGLRGVTAYLMYAEPADTTRTTSASGRPDASNPWRIKRQQITDAAGHYVFRDLEPGSYVLRFVDHYDEMTQRVLYQPMFYRDSEVFSRATPVDVRTGLDTVVDVRMQRSANWGIKGRVLLAGVPNPLPIAKISVRLFLDGELTREVLTNSDGNYDFGGVDPGTYTLAFVDLKNGRGAYATSWANDGQPITVGSDKDLVQNGTMVSCPDPPPAEPLQGCA